MASLTLKNTALILGSMLIGGALTAALYARWAPTHSAAPAAEQQRKVLFWYDPMYPNTRFDKPGKSPFMDVDLVPKYADEESSASGVRIDPTQTQNLGGKTATVTRGPLTFAQPGECQLQRVSVCHCAGSRCRVYRQGVSAYRGR